MPTLDVYFELNRCNGGRGGKMYNNNNEMISDDSQGCFCWLK